MKKSFRGGLITPTVAEYVNSAAFAARQTALCAELANAAADRRRIFAAFASPSGRAPALAPAGASGFLPEGPLRGLGQEVRKRMARLAEEA